MSNCGQDERFLQDLSSIQWRRFEPLNPVPLSLRIFRRPKTLEMLFRELYYAPDSRETLVYIFGELFDDDGQRAESCSAAIPFLGRLLRLVDDPVVPVLMDCLVALGVGFENECLEAGGVAGAASFDLPCYRAVEREAYRFTFFLDHPEVVIRLMACRALAWFPSHASFAVDAIRRLSQRGNEEEQVASFVTRGLIRDPVELDDCRSSRVQLAKAIAHGECYGLEESSFSFLLKACEASSSFECEPFGFSLATYAAELLLRSGDWLEKFLVLVKSGPIVDEIHRLRYLASSWSS